MRVKLFIVAVIIVISLVAVFGSKLFLLGLGAAYREESFSDAFHEQGGWRGFLGTASNVQLAGDPDSIIATAAARRGLKSCGEQDGVIELLKMEHRESVRSPLLQSLAACKSRAAIPYFREALLSDSVELVAVGAQSLGWLNARESIPDLQKIVDKETPRTDAVAALALAEMGEHQSSYPWAVKALLAPQPQQDKNAIDHLKRYYAMKVLELKGDRSDLKYLEMNKDYFGATNVEFLAAEQRLREAKE